MSATGANLLISQARTAYQSGDRNLAIQLVSEAIQLDKNNEDAWMWMSWLVDNNAEKRQCLKRVLSVNPRNEAAQKLLAQIPATARATIPLKSHRYASDSAIIQMMVMVSLVAFGSGLICGIVIAHWLGI